MKPSKKRSGIERHRPRLILDTNLLLLALVGAADTSLIRRFKQTQNYTAADFNAVAGIASRSAGLVITPNIATETSNWIAHLKDAAFESVWRHFCSLLVASQEVYVPSATACRRTESSRLRITDCSILMAAKDHHLHVLTDDGPLYHSLLALGVSAFHLQQLR